MRPTVSFPPTVSLTFQITTLFVPPETASENCRPVETFTVTVAGAIAIDMPVALSVHEDEEETVLLDEVVEQDTAAVVAAALWHAVMTETPSNSARN